MQFQRHVFCFTFYHHFLYVVISAFWDDLPFTRTSASGRELKLECVVSEVAVGKECLYPGHCTFAYCQEEIDVWTLERKGFISRELLFDPFGHSSNIRLTVPKILQEHHGIFMFLCGVSISL